MSHPANLVLIADIVNSDQKYTGDAISVLEYYVPRNLTQYFNEYINEFCNERRPRIIMTAMEFVGDFMMYCADQRYFPTER